jgi:hypothetical protein
MAAVLAVTLTGCGSSNKTTRANDQDDEQYLQYTQCLQKQGIKASYSRDSQGRYHFDADTGPNDPKFIAAKKACTSYVPQRMKQSASPEELDKLVKIADCMRK